MTTNRMRRWTARLAILSMFAAGPVFADGEIAPESDIPELAPIPGEGIEAASGTVKGANPMSHHIIRPILMSHCKRGPDLCPKCRAMGGPRICLLDIAPPDQGMVQRRVIGVTIDGKRVWREFDIVRVFADEAEARAWAAGHNVEIDLAAPAE